MSLGGAWPDDCTRHDRPEAVRPQGSEHVVDAAFRACVLAFARRGPVVFACEGVRVLVHPRDMALPVAERWNRKRVERLRRRRP